MQRYDWDRTAGKLDEKEDPPRRRNPPETGFGRPKAIGLEYARMFVLGFSVAEIAMATGRTKQQVRESLQTQGLIAQTRNPR